MMSLDTTIKKLKFYIGEGEEDILLKKFDELFPLFHKISNELPVNGKKFNLIMNLSDSKYIKIENSMLRFWINQEKK
ncbi:TPA: DUF3942 family protein [Bacillus cereus]|nr:DUF3942 family protein [Bacillus cereus]